MALVSGGCGADSYTGLGLAAVGSLERVQGVPGAN